MYRIIEIEINSECNRKCDWCPNKYYPREKQFLHKYFLQKFLYQLQKYNFNGVFSFSRYNEPFIYPEKLDSYIRIVKNFFPKNKIVCNTNGDFITQDIIENTLIDELTIMHYDKDLNQTILIEKDNGKKILHVQNWDSMIKTDRGGVLKKYQREKRIKPCYEPKYFLGINVDGTVSPCCNIRSDIQKDYIIGDIKKDSLEEIAARGKKFAEATATGIFTPDMPCYYCQNCGGRYTRKNGGIEYD